MSEGENWRAFDADDWERAARREARRAQAMKYQDRTDCWTGPDGTAMPPPDLWAAAGRLEGIRAHPCPRCNAAPGEGCRNERDRPTAEHRERVTVALRADGSDATPVCGGRTKRGRLCPEPAMPGDVYCRTHRDKARRGLPV